MFRDIGLSSPERSIQEILGLQDFVYIWLFGSRQDWHGKTVKEEVPPAFSKTRGRLLHYLDGCGGGGSSSRSIVTLEKRTAGQATHCNETALCKQRRSSYPCHLLKSSLSQHYHHLSRRSYRPKVQPAPKVGMAMVCLGDHRHAAYEVSPKTPEA